MPSCSRSGPRCSSIRSALKRSWPAGTGVCVVKITSRGIWLRRRVEVQALFLHAVANRLEDRKAAVPFVQVQHARE